MSTYNLTSKYDFNMSGAMVTLGFTSDNQLYTKMMMIQKAAPLNSISSVTVKKGALTSKLQYDIKERKNEKEKLFQVVQIDSSDPLGIRFVTELKEKLPKDCIWNDKLSDQTVKTVGNSHVYNLQIMWFIKGKVTAGWGWGAQMFMSYGMLTIATIGLTLPLALYAFIAGCHRVTTNDEGIAIKKLGNKFFSWDEVDRIEAGKYHISVTKYGVETDSVFLSNFNLVTKSGKECRFIMRSLEGKQFVQEMIDRKKMSTDFKGMFI